MSHYAGEINLIDPAGFKSDNSLVVLALVKKY